jgi:multidrug transporter EmrE-like cation transporter
VTQQLVLASVAAVCFTVGGAFMKKADGVAHAGPTALFLLLFVAGAAALSASMRGADLSTTYIIVLGLEAAMAATLGVVLFGEPMGVAKLAAIVLVVAGIAMLRSA